jgi:short-subunit dehydrogenase
LEGMSESLRRELMLYGIDVIVIGPGAVVTAIWDKAEGEEYGPYRNTDYGTILDRFAEYFIAEGRKGLAPEVVGEAVYRALTAARPNVRYAVVGKKLQDWTLPRLLPKRMLDRLIGRQTGLLAAK